MKTVHVVGAVAVAAVLGAGLSVLTIRSVLPPAPVPPHDHPELMEKRSCHDVLGPGPREAAVLVTLDNDDECSLKTIPNRLEICVEDYIDWDTTFIGSCNRFRNSELTIELKVGNSGTLDTELSSGKVRGRFQARPPGCEDTPHCHRQYTVTLTRPNGEELEEDPHIDIWN